MIDSGFIRIYTSDDRSRVQDVNDKLLDRGIGTILVSSDRARSAWEIEVSPEDAATARAIIERS